MRMIYHLLVSSLIGMFAAIFFWNPLLFGVAIFTGAVIDFDHVIVACIRHRSLGPLLYTIEVMPTTTPAKIFNRYPIYGVPILIGLHLIEGIVLGLITIYFFTTAIHVTAMLSIGLHIIMDILDKLPQVQSAYSKFDSS